MTPNPKVVSLKFYLSQVLSSSIVFWQTRESTKDNTYYVKLLGNTFHFSSVLHIYGFYNGISVPVSVIIFIGLIYPVSKVVFSKIIINVRNYS